MIPFSEQVGLPTRAVCSFFKCVEIFGTEGFPTVGVTFDTNKTNILLPLQILLMKSKEIKRFQR